jgi:hypothetical protein
MTSEGRVYKTTMSCILRRPTRLRATVHLCENNEARDSGEMIAPPITFVPSHLTRDGNSAEPHLHGEPRNTPCSFQVGSLKESRSNRLIRWHLHGSLVVLTSWTTAAMARMPTQTARGRHHGNGGICKGAKQSSLLMYNDIRKWDWL